MQVRRYAKTFDAPDKFTYDIVYVDRLTGKEIMRYDGADPANTNERDYGAIPDACCFANRGLDINEKVEESRCVANSTWTHRYDQSSVYTENEDDYDDNPRDDIDYSEWVV